jgi:hypothetical protein
MYFAILFYFWLLKLLFCYSQVNYLAKLGGRSPQKTVSGILRRLISKKVAVQYNYTGAHQKLAFENLNISKIIVGENLNSYHFYTFFMFICITRM